MIGSGLKKLAKANGMRVSSGVAYGNYQGFAATFSEGSGYKRIDFATRIPDPARKSMFSDRISTANLQKEYRVQQLAVSERRIQIIFADSIGTMKRIQAFLDWFVPQLRLFGATGVNTCVNCGTPLAGGRWVMLDGTAYWFHEHCLQNITGQIANQNAQRRAADSGSYGSGLLGALGGALLGALVWALVLATGYVASIVGLLIGFLSEKGYDLLKGKQGGGKVAILIISVVFGVVIGTVGGHVGMYLAEYGSSYAFADIVAAALGDLMADPSGLIQNLFMGFLFAALGVFALIRNAGKKVADDTITYLG